MPVFFEVLAFPTSAGSIVRLATFFGIFFPATVKLERTDKGEKPAGPKAERKGHKAPASKPPISTKKNSRHEKATPGVSLLVNARSVVHIQARGGPRLDAWGLGPKACLCIA